MQKPTQISELVMTALRAKETDDVDRACTIEPATETVLTGLREMIVTGEIAPGSRLRAESLASRLNVSRTPIRSALAVLATEGLVSYSINKGYTAERLAIREILDAIEVRAVLEGYACRLSVDYGWNSSELLKFASAVERGRDIVDAGGWSESIERSWYAANREFHRMIAAESHNRVLRNAIRISIIYPVFGDIGRLSPAVAEHVPQRLRQVPETVPDHIAESQADHEAVLNAIRNRDAIAAEQLMMAHVLRSRDRVNAIATRR